MAPVILVANPGSASRKYAIFVGEQEHLRLHFEQTSNGISCSIEDQNGMRVFPTEITHLDDALNELPKLLEQSALSLQAIALRIVAPSAIFLQDHLLDDSTTLLLNDLQSRAPLHIASCLHELALLHQQWPGIPVYGISDSAFHITKPDYAWNYGIPLHDADALDIKRFGYHGLSLGSAIKQLEAVNQLPRKLVICHLGSGDSVTAVCQGKSVDTTMGFSPLEGLVMGTRSGSIDFTATRALKEALHFTDKQLEEYLNESSGLLGLSGISADIRELLTHEQAGNYQAGLALRLYINRVQQAVGQMAASMGGMDGFAFTGTVGERSEIMRRRIIARLHFLDLGLDHVANRTHTQRERQVVSVHSHSSRPIYIIPVQEEKEMARRTLALIQSA